MRMATYLQKDSDAGLVSCLLCGNPKPPLRVVTVTLSFDAETDKLVLSD